MQTCRAISSIFSVIFVTVPSMDIGRKISRDLIENKLAACVNIIPQITSIYEWKGKIEEDNELMLIIKTKTNKIEEAKHSVIKNHPYDVPEFICLPIEQGSESYLKWIENQVKK